MKSVEAAPAVAKSASAHARPQSRRNERDCSARSGAPCGTCQRCKRAKWAGIQAKARIPEASDALELEADRAADLVLAMGTPPPEPANDRPKDLVQRRATGVPPAATDVPAAVARTLRTAGEPLAQTHRRFFEQRYGHDFGRIRIHADSAAAASAREIDAQAYTAGSHIVFDQGRFDPSGIEGRRLLAHELAHVVQQRAAPALPSAAEGRAASGPPVVGSSTAPVIARKGNPPSAKEERVVVVPETKAGAAEEPWFVYAQEGSGATRRRKLPGGTRVEATGVARPDVRTDGAGKSATVMLRQVRVLSVPQGDAAVDVVGKTGMIAERFLAPPDGRSAAPASPATPTAKAAPAAPAATPARFDAADLDKRRKDELTRIATAMAAKRSEQQRLMMEAKVAPMQVGRGVFGNVGGGGAIQVSAQAAAEPVKDQLLAVADALAELEARIEKDPLFAFAGGLVDGVRQNLDVAVFTRNADTFVKFAVYWNLDPSLQSQFFLGTVDGVKKEIEGLVELVSDLGEVLDQLVELAKAICSDGGAEVTRALGQQIGADWARRMTEIGGMTDLGKLARALGETFGPLLIEIAIGFATGGSSVAASASARVASLVAKFPKLQAFFSKIKGLRKLAPGGKKHAPGAGAPGKPHLPDAGARTAPHSPGGSPDPGSRAPGGEAPGGSAAPPAGRKPFPKEEADGLRHLAKNPENVRRVSDKKLLAEGYEIEIPSGGHTYRRKADGTWCRFSVKTCGYSLDEESDARFLAAAAKREQAIVAGWAIEDYVTRLGYQRPKEFNFPGIDGWKGGKGRGGHGIPTIVDADVIQIKGVSSMRHSAINDAYDKGVAGLLKDSFEGKQVRLVNPKSRTLHILFDQDTYSRLGIRQQDEIRNLIRTLNALKQNPPITVVWHYFSNGRKFQITP